MSVFVLALFLTIAMSLLAIENAWSRCKIRIKKAELDLIEYKLNIEMRRNKLEARRVFLAEKVVQHRRRIYQLQEILRSQIQVQESDEPIQQPATPGLASRA